MAIGYLGLGSNVGDRRAHLQAAVDALPAHTVRVVASSSTYDTDPVGEILDQPDFLNACLRIETALDPEALLDACKAVEGELGRTQGGPRHGPRPIDVDVLLAFGRAHASDRLTVPHPGLLELDPQLALPDGTRLSAALAGLGDGQDVRLVGPPLI